LIDRRDVQEKMEQMNVEEQRKKSKSPEKLANYYLLNKKPRDVTFVEKLEDDLQLY